MLIRLGYDIRFAIGGTAPIIAMLNVHPSRVGDLLEPDILRVEPGVEAQDYVDSFGNTCCRFLPQPGPLRLWNSTLIEDSGEPDPVAPDARQHAVEDLPPETLRYLLASRYCEVDLMSNLAAGLFGAVPQGWARVQAVCDWVYQHVTFGYQFARPTKSALDVYNERQGVCRDFQHLAITFCSASIFRLATPPDILATSGFPSRLRRWILAPGLRFFLKDGGGHSTRATIPHGLGAS